MSARMAPVLGDRSPVVEAPSERALLIKKSQDGVVTLTLNRPSDFNALTLAMLRRCLDVLDELAEDDDARVIVIDSVGTNFCCGADHADIRADADAPDRFYRMLSRLMIALTQLPQPVIAKVRGLAASEGCQLVAGCDLAVAGRSARFALPDLDAGLVCALPMVALGRSVGSKRAMDMAMTGAVVQADEALEMGLIGRLVSDGELDATVAEMAGHIARRPRSAVAGGKEAFYRQVDLPLAQAYDAACEAMARTRPGGEKPKRKAVFQATRLTD